MKPRSRGSSRSSSTAGPPTTSLSRACAADWRSAIRASRPPRLDAVVRGALASAPGLGALSRRAGSAASTAIALCWATGGCSKVQLVVDARGPEAVPARMRSGLESSHCDDQDLTLGDTRSSSASRSGFVEPGTVTRPVIMDATVAQLDGFRFVYTLPLAPDRVLVEDTYFSDSPGARSRRLAGTRPRLRRAMRLRRRRGDARGDGRPARPLDVRESAFRAEGPLRAGYAGGFFHPTTGYSLPVAVRLAEFSRRCPPRSEGRRAGPRAPRTGRQSRFCRLLNWLLFCAYPPEQRFHVLERFYRLPEATIRRFYALELTMADRARLLLGRPPAGLSLPRGLLAVAGGLKSPPRRRHRQRLRRPRGRHPPAGHGPRAPWSSRSATGRAAAPTSTRTAGFTFDAGPTVITAPGCIEELFTVAGRRMADYVELLPVTPYYRLVWGDGSSFDYAGDGAVDGGADPPPQPGRRGRLPGVRGVCAQGLRQGLRGAGGGALPALRGHGPGGPRPRAAARRPHRLRRGRRLHRRRPPAAGPVLPFAARGRQPVRDERDLHPHPLPRAAAGVSSSRAAARARWCGPRAPLRGAGRRDPA